MTSSGTYTFSLSNAGITLAAFERIGIRAPSVRQGHLFNAQRELNLLFAGKFGNLQPNLWKVELFTGQLTAGTAEYVVETRVIMILDAYISLDYGTDDQTDRYITAMSRGDYAAIAQKQTDGFPTTFWFDRQIEPTITFWPTPDNNGPYQLSYYACVTVQDANLAGGETPDVPLRWQDAVVAGLAHRMSRIYAPNLEQLRKADADEAWREAAAQDTENVNFAIAPQMQGYYR